MRLSGEGTDRKGYGFLVDVVGRRGEATYSERPAVVVGILCHMFCGMSGMIK